jgi:geranylgeranyl diphosphate synthase type I
MSNNSVRVYSELLTLIEERGRKVLERFGDVTISGISHPKLLSILRDVKAYWKDVYRPALTSLSCEAVGGEPEESTDVSLIITLLAAGMGIHDDIVDKSLNKHFRMTIFGLHDLDDTLVVGDLLIVKALTAVREILEENYQPRKISDVLETYETSFVEICEGEFMEVSCRQNLDTKLEFYNNVLWKFAADTEACTKIGAILGNGTKSEVQALAEFGRRLGFMFRLVDDVKDALNIEGSLPHRLEFESVPLPLLYSAKSSKEKYLKIKSVLEKPPVTPHNVRKLLGFCFESDAFTYVYNIAKQNAKMATHNLRLVRPNNARTALTLMINKPLADIAKLCC